MRIKNKKLALRIVELISELDDAILERNHRTGVVSEFPFGAVQFNAVCTDCEIFHGINDVVKYTNNNPKSRYLREVMKYRPLEEAVTDLEKLIKKARSIAV